MAQKYDLITVPTVKATPAKFQPWYKERLELKFSKSLGLRTSLRGRDWIFIRGDVDDWRDGTPSSERLIIRNKSNLLPVLSSRIVRPQRLKRKQIIRNGKTATLYTKEGARQQLAKERIENLEQSLTNHPLALYPHLEKSVPIEMFDEVVELLDPDMKPTGSEIEMTTPPDSPLVMQERPSTRVDNSKPEKSATDDEIEQQAAQHTIYRWPMIGVIEESSNDNNPSETDSPDSKVEQVTKDLCKWMKNLNVEDDPSLDEGKIKELFTNDYETNKNWSIPVRVVELTTIPLELRGASAQYSRSVSAQSHRLHSASSAFMLPKSMEKLPHRYIRTRYGAWYLPKNLWKPMPSHEKLRDPKEIMKEATSEIKTDFLDTDLADTHAARAFKEYISTRRKTSRKAPPRPSVPRSLLRTNQQVKI